MGETEYQLHQLPPFTNLREPEPEGNCGIVCVGWLKRRWGNDVNKNNPSLHQPTRTRARRPLRDRKRRLMGEGRWGDTQTRHTTESTHSVRDQHNRTPLSLHQPTRTRARRPLRDHMRRLVGGGWGHTRTRTPTPFINLREPEPEGHCGIICVGW